MKISMKDSYKFYITVFITILCFITTLISVGFGALNQNLNIAGDVEYDKDIGNMINTRSSGLLHFHDSDYYNKIISIDFLDNKTVPSNALVSWDVSLKQNGKVIAWLINDASQDGYYKLYIGADGDVLANFDSTSLFYNLPNLKSISFNNNFDTSQVVNMSSMFLSCPNLQTIDISSFDTSKVQTMTSMFSNDSLLQSIDLSMLDTSSLLSSSTMFSNCSELKSANLSNFIKDTQQSYSGLFANCYKLEDLNLSNCDFKSISSTNLIKAIVGMSYSTVYNYMIKRLDLSNSKFYDRMYGAFSDLNKLEEINLTNVDTSTITDMAIMFSGDSSLKSINLSSFDTSQVERMDSMFFDCSSLENIDLSSLDTANCTNFSTMFKGCTSLTNLDLSHLDFSEQVSVNSIILTTNLKYLNINGWNLRKINNPDSTGLLQLLAGGSQNSITKLDAKNVDFGTKMDKTFQEMSNLEEIDLSNCITKDVTSMRFTFDGCSKLTSIDVSDFDTSNVTSFNSIFYRCESLTSIDLSNFDTSKVTDMWGMFDDCTNIETINLTNFDFRGFQQSNMMARLIAYNSYGVTTTAYPKLKTLILNNTKYGNDMRETFEQLRPIERIDLNNVDTSEVTNMWKLFWGCNQLKELDIRSFNTSNVTNMDEMFSYTTALTSIKVSNQFTTANATTTNMFDGSGVDHVTVVN